MIKKMIKKLGGSEWGKKDKRLLLEALDELYDAGLIEKRLRHDGQMEYRARTVPTTSDRGTSHSTEEGQ